MEKEIKPEDKIQIIAITDIEVFSFIKGYHTYRKIWLPVLDEELYGEMDCSNNVDKYAAVTKRTRSWIFGYLDIIAYLPLSRNGKLTKTIFYFLRTDAHRNNRD